MSEGLPLWYTEMEEIVLWITHIHLSKFSTLIPPFDDLWGYSKIDNSARGGPQNVWWVNGQYQPTICQTAGQWIKYRIGQIETDEDPRIFYVGEGECTLYLLAKDGVMVHGMTDNAMPRSVGNGIFLAHSSRVDVAISCPGDRSGSAQYEIWHSIRSNRAPSGFEKVVIALIEVTGTATVPETTLSPFKPIRPDYLENLMPGHYAGNLEYQQYQHCEGRGRNAQCSSINYLRDVEVSGIWCFRCFVSESI